jgi:hypothetical protein
METTKNAASKMKYEAPTVKVVQVSIEGYIANSGNHKVVLEDWKPDPDEPAVYDGDMWMEF